MAVLRSLVTTIGLNSAQFRSELIRSQRSFKSFSDYTKRSAKAVSASVNGMTSAVISMKTALVSIGTGAALYGLKQSYENTAEIKRQADMVGVAAGKWDAYTKAAKQVGITGDQLSDVFKDLNVRITDTAKGGTVFEDFFKQINQSAVEWAKLSPDEQFRRFTEEINKMTETDARFWLDELNDAAVSLYPSLVKNKGELTGLADEASDLGLALTTAQIERIEQANKDMSGLAVTAGGLWDQVKAVGAPALSAITTEINNWIIGSARANGGFNRLGETIAVSVLGAVTAVAEAVEALLNNSYTKIRQLYKFMGWELADGSKELEQALKDAEEQYNSLYDSIYTPRTDNQASVIETEEDARKLNELQKTISSLRQQLEKPFDFSKVVRSTMSNAIEQIRSSPVINIPINTNQTGGTGVGIVGGLKDDLDKLKAALADKEALVINQTKKELEILKQGKEQKLITQQEYDQLEKELYKQRFEEYAEVSEDFWTQFAGHVEKSVTDFDTVWGNAFNRFASGFGDAVADSILEGKNFGEMMAGVAKGLAKNMISALVEIAAKKATLWLMEKTLLKGQQAGFVAKVTGEAQAGAQLAAINSYASAAAIPVTGWAMAPGISAAALAATEGMAALATTAASSSLAGMAHDGMDYIPREGTWLLDKGERVVDRRTNEDLKGFLSNSKNGGSQPGGIIFNLINNGEPAKVEDSEEYEDDFGNRVVDVILMDQRNGGEITNGFQGMWGLNRKGQF